MAQSNNDVTSSASADDAKRRQRALGARLRELFDEVVNEPIPDEFLKLLEEAEKKDSAK